MNTTEGNKLIAEFCGYKYHKKVLVDNSDCGGLYDDMDIWSKREILVNDYGDQVYFSDDWYKSDGYKESIYGDLKYHTSWDWLMPVVEKVESIHDDHHGYFGVHISSNSCSIQGTNLHMALNHSNYGAVYMSDPNAILKTKIESTWYNIVQFILWYNTQSK